MIRKTKSAALNGFKSMVVNVECYSGQGLPQIKVVGMAESVVKESFERVRAAVKTCGYSMPPGRIIVNLSPSEVKKDGTQFDLPIALAMVFSGIEETCLRLEEYVFLGELSLSGEVVESEYLISLAIQLSVEGITKIAVPLSCREEIMKIKGLEAVYIKDLNQAVDFVMRIDPENSFEASEEDENLPDIRSKWEGVNHDSEKLDFGDVIGLHLAKRAIEVACCGRHNIILTGPPGIGKSMLLSRASGIMPDMEYEDSLTVSQIYSLHGIKRDILEKSVPVRRPSLTISQARFMGGFSGMVPGEVSLAHRGLLIMDELGEFKRDVLNGLRDVMDTKSVELKRNKKISKLPGDFTLMATANPCKCGFSGTNTPCVCSAKELAEYGSKLSGPLLDRIDIKVFIDWEKEYEHLVQSEAFQKKQREFTGEKMKNRIFEAVEFGRERNRGMGIVYNSQINESFNLDEIGFSKKESDYFEGIFSSGIASRRSQGKVARIARTLADFDKSQWIKREHINEALVLNGAFLSRR